MKTDVPAVFVALTALAACASRDVPPEQPTRPIGPTERHVAPPGTMPPDTRPPPLAHTPAELRQLTMATQALGGDGHHDHTRVAAALDALAEAVMLVGGDREQLVRRTEIRAQVDRLRDSPPHARDHADIVRRALDYAHLVMGHGSPRSRWNWHRYVDAVVAFKEATRAIQPDVPLLVQHRQVVAAFRAAVTALEIAVGVAP